MGLNQPVIFGAHDHPTLAQMQLSLETGGERAVLLADGHLGYNHPIGGVVAYKDKISLSGVGFDIACGVIAVQTDLTETHVRDNIAEIMETVVNEVSFGVGRKNKTPVDDFLFEDPLWQREPWSSWKKDAEAQLGTVGSGNHYVDILVDRADGSVWVACHFGSRGLGHKTATHFLNKLGAPQEMKAPPCVIDVNSQDGQDYLLGMALAGQYAYAGREWVADKVVKSALGGTILQVVHNHHNYAWKETHFGEEYWVVRKGATPAFPGQRGFVGGSMGDDAVIVEGVDSELSRQALYSTVHGAGRVMSRTAAKGRTKKVDGKLIRGSGLVRHDEMQKWIKDRGVHLRGADLDEAPQAYRRLSEVLEYHKDTITIVHTLTPIGVAMAGADINDPYKD